MRNLTFICLILSGCGDHSIKDGDCFVSGNYGLYRILEVGTKGGYRVEDDSCKIYNWNTLSGGFTLTDCFQSFKQCDRNKSK